MKLKNLLSGKLEIGPCILGIGTFDGVHLGHRSLIENIINCSKETGLPAVIFTFDHSPRKYLNPEVFKGYLTTPAEKFSLLLGTGVDYVVFRPFDQEFSQVSYQDFVSDIICDSLDARITFVGFNFCFGAGRSGTADMLAYILRQNGRECRIIEPVKVEGEIVSSSIIRQAVAEGDFVRANRFLGRESSFSGAVVHGDHRGRQMGFPTANLQLEESEKILPPNGVYACYADTPKGSFKAMVNVGIRPTFNRSNHLLEAHLLGFSGDLYHRTIRIRFVKRIREEKKFPDMNSLTEQIQRDQQTTERILTQNLEQQAV
jgi:riboflavin kinase/FMN adenylyltransferase